MKRGFTLIEMMVVVAILLIVSVIVFPSLKPHSKPVDVSQRLSNLIDLAARDAVRWGMVRSDVATTEGSKRRTRVRATGTTRPTFIAEVLIEDQVPLWQEIGSYQVPTTITSDGWSTIVGDKVAAGTLSTTWTSFVISCFPNGICTSGTVFFSTTSGPNKDRQSRISVLPLGGSTYVRNSW